MMSKKKDKKALVPLSRFPGFEEEWESKKVSTLGLNVTAGATPDTTNKKYWGGNVRWMNSGELNLKKVYEVENRITKLGLEESSTKMLPKFCVLIGLAGQGKTRGTVAMNMVELCTNQSIAAIHPSKNLNSDFLYHELDDRYEELRRISAGDGGRGGLNLQHIKDLDIVFPPSPIEQQKIADCLSSLDEVIGLQGKKVEALKAHKKALMQSLFPAEGQTVPKLRFPEFRDAGGWEISPLKSFCRIQTGKKDANEGVEGGKYPFFTCADKHIYSNSYSFDSEAILVAGNANVGQTKYYNGKFEAYQRTYVLNEFSGIKVRYLYTLLSSSLQSSLLKQVQTSAMSYIKLPMLQDYPIMFPRNFKEQEKIAGFLSSVDDAIALAAQKLAALKEHKKSLMQQLFPTLDKVDA